ncbi:MAG: FAS1-like dehydratase domain-containing protein [Dehalococcoidia bacterium]
MTTEQSVITDEMRQAIGVESEPWTVEVEKTGVRMYARAIGYTDPIFFDEASAKEEGYRSLPCPPGFLGTPIFDPATSDPTFGQPRRGQRRFNTPYTRGLNGGTDIEYFTKGSSDAICAGDVLQASSKIADLTERRGSLGPMLITTSETIYRRDGTVVAIMRGTGIAY